MSLGAVLVIPPGHAEAAERSLLGAPVFIRALAAALLPQEEVHALAVAPPSLHGVLKAEADRFGLAELEGVLPFPEDERQGVLAALARLPGDVDVVVVQPGVLALCSLERMTRLVEAARRDGLAVSAMDLPFAVAARAPELRAPLDGPLCVVQGPWAARPTDLREVLEASTEGGVLASLLASRRPVTTVEGDRDTFPLEEGTDLTRALEVMGRRATDFAFVWPRPEGVDAQVALQSPVPSPEEAARRAGNVTIPDGPPARGPA
jgi:hypothetical protein